MPVSPGEPHYNPAMTKLHFSRSAIVTSVAFLATPLAALLAAAPASAADSLCPATVNVKQSGAAPTPAWTVSYSTTPSELEMVTFYSGPPKDEASLVYDRIVKTKDSSLATWNFGPDPHGYWVKCSYSGTTIELSQPLPPTLKSCRVTYSREETFASGLPTIRNIACQ
jgi:hypothetical protein